MDATIGEFLRTLRTESTQKAYSKDLEQFSDFLSKSKIGIIAAKCGDIMKFLSRLPVSGPTKERKRCAIRSLYRWLVENKRLAANPTDMAPSAPFDKKPRLPRADAAEAELVLGSAEAGNAKEMRDKLCLLLIIRYGLKASRIPGLKDKSLAKIVSESDLPFAEQYLEAKRGHERFSSSRWLIPEKTGSRMDVRSVRRIFGKYTRKAGVAKTRPLQFRNVLAAKKQRI